MIYLQLFYEFFKIGLFAIGGGLASLPFLYTLVEKYGWFDTATLSNMIAISESTPGPIGINMATYTGFHVGGVGGGMLATFANILPALVFATIVIRFLEKFKTNDVVQAAFYGLRPAVTGLIAAAAYQIIQIALLNIDLFMGSHQILDLFQLKSLLLFAVILPLTLKLKWHPIVYIFCAAALGVLFQFA